MGEGRNNASPYARARALIVAWIGAKGHRIPSKGGKPWEVRHQPQGRVLIACCCAFWGCPFRLNGALKLLAVALLGLRFRLNGALKLLAGASWGGGSAPLSANGVALAIGASPLAVVASFGRSKNGKGEAPTAKAHWRIWGRTQPPKPRKRKQMRPILSQSATPKSAKAQATAPHFKPRGNPKKRKSASKHAPRV